MLNDKKNKIIPWGIFAGISLMICSYFAFAVVVVKIVSYQMIVNSGGDDGLGQSWWISLLIAGAIATFVAFAFFLVMYILRNKKLKKLSIDNK